MAGLLAVDRCRALFSLYSLRMNVLWCWKLINTPPWLLDLKQSHVLPHCGCTTHDYLPGVCICSSLPFKSVPHGVVSRQYCCLTPGDIYRIYVSSSYVRPVLSSETIKNCCFDIINDFACINAYLAIGFQSHCCSQLIVYLKQFLSS